MVSFCEKTECKWYGSQFNILAGPVHTLEGSIEVSPCLVCTEFKKQNMFTPEVTE